MELLAERGIDVSTRTCCAAMWLHILPILLGSVWRSEAVDYCAHVLAAGSTSIEEWYESPFSQDGLPHLSTLPSEGYWSTEQKSACFGDLTPLLQSYEDFDGSAAPPRKHEIVDNLIADLLTTRYCPVFERIL